jgi:hypothetical protein
MSSITGVSTLVQLASPAASPVLVGVALWSRRQHRRATARDLLAFLHGQLQGFEPSDGMNKEDSEPGSAGG